MKSIVDFHSSYGGDCFYKFMREFHLNNVVKMLTCFKFNCPTYIDLVLASDKGKLSNIKVIETGPLEYHAKVVTTLNCSFHKNNHMLNS